MDKMTHPYFIADDAAGTRKETAILLVGTADEYGIDQHSVRMVRGGFRVTQEMADALGIEDDEAEDGAEDGAETEPVLTGQVPVPENDLARPDVDERERDRIGDEVPTPDTSEGTREEVGAEPANPVEAETPQFVENAEGVVKSVPANAEDPFDPSEHTIDGVKAHVESNPDSANAVLGLEREGQNRKTLVAWLTERATQ